MMVKKTTAAAAAADENDNKQTLAFDSLLAELESHNDFFDDLVDMFPAKLYVQGPTGDEMYNPKYKKGLHKESKDARKARNKQAKRAKYDPSQSETTLETIRRKEEEDDVQNSNNKSAVRPPQRRIDISNSSSTCENNNTTTTTSSRIDMLRAKLQAKIAEQRKNRPTTPTTDGTISKRAARRAAKQKRINDAIERNKKLGHSSTTNNNNNTQHHAATTTSSTTPSSTREDDDLSGLSFGTLAGLPNATNPSKKQHSLTDNNKSLHPRKKKKNLEHLLHDAEKKKQRLKELKSSTIASDRDKASRMEWSDAFKDADGQRRTSKDDPAAIKTAMKRREKKKKKSAMAWKSRVEQMEGRKEERQTIRSYNLDQRKKGGVVGANLSKKRIVDLETKGADDPAAAAVGGEGAAKGGRTKRRRMGPHAAAGGSRVGFEGKKREFINKKGKGETQ